MNNKIIISYLFQFILITSLILGGLFGYYFGDQVSYLKPFGDIFLNLILTAIVPMIFFSVSSAIAKAGALNKLGKIMSSMMVVFLLMGVVASVLSIVMVTIFPPAQGLVLQHIGPIVSTPINLSQQLVNIFTVTDFYQLFSHESILALIIFAVLIGLACVAAKEKTKSFVSFLQSGEVIFTKVFSFIMFYAPIGFFAYFAVFVHDFGPELMKSYARIAAGYALFSMMYFVIVYGIFAYIAGHQKAVKAFWQYIWLPTITALATCSSAASIPANLVATKAMGVSPEVAETVVPLGTIIHKQGSIIGGIVKISFLFGIYHMSFSTPSVLLTALGVSILVGTVMGAIPSGGMLGELLIISVYGFPPSALVSIVAISIIIDPFATMLNVTGNSIASMLVSRFVEKGRGS